MPGGAGGPPPFTVADYRARTAGLKVVGGVVVADPAQGSDPAPLLAAARELGPRFVVVAQARPEMEDAEMAALAARGVRGLRYSLFPGPWRDANRAAAHAERAAAHGLHAEFHADGTALVPAVMALARLPALVIDQLGMSDYGLPVVRDLAVAGARIKASGFGRATLDVAAALESIAHLAPRALMVGTDLPSAGARRPFEAADLALVQRVLGSELARAALHDTATAFYRAGDRAQLGIPSGSIAG